MSVMKPYRELVVSWIFAGLVVSGLIGGASLLGFENPASPPPVSEAWPGTTKHRGVPTTEGERGLPLEYDRGDADAAGNVLSPGEGESST